MILAIYILMNGVERFLIEKIRVNATYDLLGMEVTQAEIVSSIFIIAGVVMILILARGSKKKLHQNT